MAKITMNKVAPVVSASAEIVAKATQVTEVTDKQGRVLSLRKPGMLAQFRLVEMLGESAKNQIYLAMVTPLLYVTAIDGEPVVPVAKKSELEALIQRLDEDGVEAVHNEVMGSADAPATAEDAKASLKN